MQKSECVKGSMTTEGKRACEAMDGSARRDLHKLYVLLLLAEERERNV